MSYTVLIAEGAQSKIDRYTDLYADYYRNLYHDSGLGQAEEIIIGQYVDIATRLNTLLHASIEKTLNPEIVLERFDNHINHNSMVTVSLGRRRLFLTYRDIIGSHTRILLDIEISRK